MSIPKVVHQIILPAAAFGVLFIFVANTYAHKSTPPPIDSAPEIQEQYWIDHIGRMGGERAYALFSRRVASLTEPDKHLAAHAFGAALYSIEGINGLKVCDEQYGYGCLHQFFGHAIAGLGVGVIQELNNICVEGAVVKNLACQHSVGHGIQAALGYERSNLLQALALCKDLPNRVGAIGGCFGGVFMEYNIRTVLGPDASVREPGSNLADPCDALGMPYVESCVYWLPHWWWVAIFSEESSERTFKKLGEYCDTYIQSRELKNICFNGIGLITPKATAYDPYMTKEFCLATSENMENNLLCISNAVNIIGVTLGSETAERACEGLTASAKKYCEAYAHNEGNLVRALDVPHDL